MAQRQQRSEAGSDPHLFTASILAFGPRHRNGRMIISYESDSEAIPKAVLRRLAKMIRVCSAR